MKSASDYVCRSNEPKLHQSERYLKQDGRTRRMFYRARFKSCSPETAGVYVPTVCVRNVFPSWVWWERWGDMKKKRGTEVVMRLALQPLFQPAEQWKLFPDKAQKNTQHKPKCSLFTHIDRDSHLQPVAVPTSNRWMRWTKETHSLISWFSVQQMVVEAHLPNCRVYLRGTKSHKMHLKNYKILPHATCFAPSYNNKLQKC